MTLNHYKILKTSQKAIKSRKMTSPHEEKPSSLNVLTSLRKQKT